ncbi:hypothetical protein ACH9L7_00130 [Haloferax sp. S1W]|uniref:hypothetical protein n=1 Tax=Haloferax sp. S1W TaxID=3377110 RepID=UPI0037C8F134
MSTNTRPTYEPQLRTDRRSSRSTDTAGDKTDTDTTGTTDADSWIAQCQRQFESKRTERLHNLFDRENQSMPKMD